MLHNSERDPTPDQASDPTARLAAEGSQGAPAGSWYAWWQGDPLPALPPLPGLAVETVADDQRIAQLLDIAVVAARELLRQGHHLYLARLPSVPTPVAYGWSATATASIGELSLSLTLPPRNHYLWGFQTDPAWRGRGIYPRLLQAVLASEQLQADRFWIGHEPGNSASARGILAAGFQRVGDLYTLPDGALGLHADGMPHRAAPSAVVLGVPLLTP